jgi:dihydropteroate synthase
VLRPRTRLVGIVNVTPDSFSDGGKNDRPQTALAAIERLIGEGAQVIDIGAESTRPGAMPLAHEEEWSRLSPVLAGLSRFAPSPVAFSVDTRHPETAAKALKYNIQWINDVSGFASAAMVAAVKSSACKLVVMHSLSVPADKTIIMASEDPVAEILIWAVARLGALQQAGIARERLIFDPGIGFGKTSEQSLFILKNIGRFTALGVPLLVGHSRKSFLNLPASASIEERDDATLTMSKYLVAQGVDYLRVHNIPRHAAMISHG